MKKTKQKNMNKDVEKLTTCLTCERKFKLSQFCEKCQNQDPHHQRKVPKGACQQCLEKGLPLTKSWNDKHYCADCLNWNEEASESGVATCARYTHDKELNCYDYVIRKNCGKCAICQERQKLQGISTIALMTELYWGRKDFAALINWRDDGFITRFQEIMWELKQVKGWTPQQIEEAVNEDIFEKKFSQRKFSRGT